MIPELAEEIAAIRRAEGLSMDTVLQGLRERREQSRRSEMRRRGAKTQRRARQPVRLDSSLLFPNNCLGV